MGTQTEIAKKIVEAGGEYVLALKENQETLHDKVELYFNNDRLRNLDKARFNADYKLNTLKLIRVGYVHEI